MPQKRTARRRPPARPRPARRPPPKPRPARRRPKPKQSVRRSVGSLLPLHRMYDAFGGVPYPPLAFSVGRATPLRGLARVPITTSPTTADTTVVVINGRAGHVVGSRTYINYAVPSIGTAAAVFMDSAGFSGTGPSATSPHSALLTRCSVRLRNTTKASDVAGSVFALNISSAVHIGTVPADWVALIDYVTGHPRTTTFSAHELRNTRQWNTHPIDQSRAHSFEEPTVTWGAWEQSLENPAFSTLVLVFPPNASANDYELTVAASYYGRYQIGGPLAHLASPPPTIGMSVLNKARDVAESAGSLGGQILTTAASNLGGAAARGGLRALGNALRPAPALEAMAIPPRLLALGA